MASRTAPIALAALILFAALAGCSASGSKAAELVIKSQPVEIHSLPIENAKTATTSNTTTANNVPVNAPKEKALGHIAGVVVDAAIRPIVGAKVRMPSLDLTHTTDRDGSFAFTDLYPGPYFLSVNMTGYEKAETLVEVQEDTFIRVKFILNELPPPAPYHSTEKFQGFADITADPASSILGTIFTCSSCNFQFFKDPAARAIILEATMDPYQYSGTIPGSDNKFDFEIYTSNYNSYYYGEGPNPLRTDLRLEQMKNGTQSLYLYPAAFPLPETAKSFEVFVTSWFNSDPPMDWSIVAGDE